ncbi:MAG TPA: superoxide dismutase family protein [Casimicrobiaceae bacterium]
MARTSPTRPGAILAGRSGVRAARTAAALVLAAALSACGETPAKFKLVEDAGAMGIARLAPKNGSTVRGFISFTQRGSKVEIAGNFVALMPGPHSLYIHTVGNCSSPNAASAGPVWNAGDAAQGGKVGKRTGELPQLLADGEGRAILQMTASDLSVGTGRSNDVIGHAVVVHAAVDPDPKPEFGVRNGWLACGVIDRGTGLDLKKLL